MKVYVVESDIYEQRGISGIYASLEAAMAAHPVPGSPEGPPMHAIVGQQVDPSPYKQRAGGWQKNDDLGCWTNGFDSGFHDEIREYEVEE